MKKRSPFFLAVGFMVLILVFWAQWTMATHQVVQLQVSGCSS